MCVELGKLESRNLIFFNIIFEMNGPFQISFDSRRWTAKKGVKLWLCLCYVQYVTSMRALNSLYRLISLVYASLNMNSWFLFLFSNCLHILVFSREIDLYISKKKKKKYCTKFYCFDDLVRENGQTTTKLRTFLTICYYISFDENHWNSVKLTTEKITIGHTHSTCVWSWKKKSVSLHRRFFLAR